MHILLDFFVLPHFLYSLLISLLASLCTAVSTCFSQRRNNHQFSVRSTISECVQGRGLGKKQICLCSQSVPLSYNTQGKQQHRLCSTRMYSSAAPNDIPCLPSLPRLLHKELLFQIQIHQYLSGQLLPKQILKKSLSRCFNCLMLAGSSNTQLFKS